MNYLYDGEGHRVAMQSNVSGTTTLTAYIGSIEEVQTSGSTTQTTTFYAVGGKRVAANVNGTFYYFGYDALGSQVAVLDATGNLVGAQLYGPYGASRYTTGTIPTSIGFTGQRADSVTGLDYYVARYYDPIVGVFLSADSVQGNMQGMEPYAYVGGNPETWTDPVGQCPWCIVLLAGVVGGAIGAVISDWVTGQPVTWQSVAEGAVAGGLIAGAGILIAMLPPVAALLASTAPAGGAVGGLSTTASYLTINAAKLGAGLIGGGLGGAISGAVTGGVTDIINHFWPPVDQNQDKINAQGTVIAQKNNQLNTKDRQLSAQATVIAKLQRRSNVPVSKKASAPRRASISRPTYTYKSTSSYRSWTYAYSYTGPSNYSFSDTVYHYANPIYNYEVVSNTSNGYYERVSGGMHMS